MFMIFFALNEIRNKTIKDKFYRNSNKIAFRKYITGCEKK